MATTTPAQQDLARIDALIDQLLAENPVESTPAKELWAAQYDLGLAWVSAGGRNWR